MNQSNDALLKIRGLSKYFGGICALSDFDLDVYPGELHCMIGPNGAGKTTALKLIMGIYEPSEGEILFKDRNITKWPSYKRVREKISIKLQVPGVFENLTLKDNIRIALENFVLPSEMESETRRLIDLVGIGSLGNPIVKYMTHGQQQWLEIAMALASKPELLLLDEPAAGLGPDETDYTAKIVTNLNKQGLTILFIEHDMNFVKKIAKKITVLHQGKKFMEGSVDDVVNNKDVINIYLGKQ